MTWDARRLCDLTSFVWVGLVDASGLEQPGRKIVLMRGIGNNGVLLLSRADSRKW